MFRKLKPYPRTALAKTTDVAFPTPQHWSAPRLKDVSRRLEGGATPSANDHALWGGGICWVTPTDMDGRAVLDRTARTLSDAGLRSCSARVFPAGAVIVSSRAPVGKVALAGVPLATSQGCKAIETDAGRMSEQYLAYQLRVFTPILQAAANGTTFAELSTDGFSRIRLIAPPLNEQAAIVKYLGHAHARIDWAIAAKRKLIALLEEQKQAVINQAVTRGLDPTVPMKDSGIPWLGEIPAHWEAPALRRYWQVVDCKHLTVPFSSSGYPLASVVQSQRFFLDLSDAKRTDETSYRSLIEGERKPRPGDLVYCRNVGVGKAAVVQTDEPFALGQDVTILRSGTQEPVFFNYFLQSPAMARQLERVLVGSTFRRINVEQIRALVIVVPPLGEQRAIVSMIQDGTRLIVAAQSRARREIELLREFRTRLTSDVVTGQVDVREIAASLPELIEPTEPDADSVDDESAQQLDELLEEADA